LQLITLDWSNEGNLKNIGGQVIMAVCISCGEKAGFMAKECAACINKRIEIHSKEEAAAKEERERARQDLIREEHSRINRDVKSGFKCFLHKTEFIPVDSEITGASFNFGQYDDSRVRLSGLEGWRVVGVVSRTFGTLLQNKVDFNSVWAGGTGGNVSGAYVLMELELTPTNVENLSEEIEEFLQETVQ
jgi:hypothetical protein